MPPDDQIAEMRRVRNAEMDKARRRRNTLAQLRGVPISMVPAAPIRSHLKRLHSLGWSYEAIAAIHGAGTGAGLRLIAAGTSMKAERKFETVPRIPYTLAVPDVVGDTMWVPSAGATRRVRALLAMGWRHEDMADLAGRSLHRFAHEGNGKTRAVDWRIIDEIFERLSAVPGGSAKTATRAVGLGYFPPLAWTDIDAPHERPRSERVRDMNALDPVVVTRILAGDWRLSANRAERFEVISQWLGSDNELERRTGWNVARDRRDMKAVEEAANAA